MRVLVIGDVHAKANDLEDCRALGELILKTVAEQRPDRVVFMGDQYDTHALVHVEVQRFWLDLFAALSGTRVVALVGNHDMVGNGVSTTANSMQVHYQNVRVVDGLQRDEGDVAYAAYGFDLTRMTPTKYLFCHHTFQGAQYENGFYAKDGIDASNVPAKWIVSGHIHKPAVLGQNIHYVGSPRWLTVADAEVARRSIHLVDTDTGVWESFATNPVVRVIHKLNDTETAPAIPPNAKPQDKVVVNVTGSAKYVEERAKELKGRGWRVRTFVNSVSNRAVKESEGVGKSWVKYVDTYSPRYETPKHILAKKAEELNVGT